LGPAAVPSPQIFSDCSLFYVILHAAIGLILLCDVSTITAWRPLDTFPITVAGLAPMNSSLAAGSPPDEFWIAWQTILIDATSVISVPPYSCSGTDCFSYFFPGGVAEEAIVHTVPEEATSYIVYETPGYQIEYYSLESTSPPWNNVTDCRIYGDLARAIQICVRQLGSDLMAGSSPAVTLTGTGINFCPVLIAVGGYGPCLSNTSWMSTIEFSTQITISRRIATTVYDINNYTILDIFDLSNPTPTNYTAEEFLDIFEMPFQLGSSLRLSSTISYGKFIMAKQLTPHCLK